MRPHGASRAEHASCACWSVGIAIGAGERDFPPNRAEKLNGGEETANSKATSNELRRSDGRLMTWHAFFANLKLQQFRVEERDREIEREREKNFPACQKTIFHIGIKRVFVLRDKMSSRDCKRYTWSFNLLFHGGKLLSIARAHICRESVVNIFKYYLISYHYIFYTLSYNISCKEIWRNIKTWFFSIFFFYTEWFIVSLKNWISLERVIMWSRDALDIFRPKDLFVRHKFSNIFFCMQCVGKWRMTKSTLT